MRREYESVNYILYPSAIVHNTNMSWVICLHLLTNPPRGPPTGTDKLGMPITLPVILLSLLGRRWSGGGFLAVFGLVPLLFDEILVSNGRPFLPLSPCT